ncbi:MAG: hypothetical protein GX756_01745, partial [Clostridiales bacterium]|nr:hypothetical protein [Clostridiales bacterium]
MDKNKELLNLIHKNAALGIISLKRVLCETQDQKFEETIQNHLKDYREFFEKTKELINKNGFQEKSPGFCTKLCVVLS